MWFDVNLSDGGGGGGGGGGSGVRISNGDLRAGQDLWIDDGEGRFSTTPCRPARSCARIRFGIGVSRHLRLLFCYNMCTF